LNHQEKDKIMGFSNIPHLDVHRVAGKIEARFADRRHSQVDEFLRPLLHSRLGHTPAYTRLKALLEHQSHQGRDPEYFLREMKRRSEKVLQQHSHELAVARNYLHILRSGNNAHRFRTEVLMPAQTRSISLNEAWRRLDNIILAPYGQPSTNLYTAQSANPPNSQGHQHGSQGHSPHGSHGSNSPGSQNPPPSNSQGGSGSSNGDNWRSQFNSLVAPSGHQANSSTLSGIGGTIGVGGAAGGSCLAGVSACGELLGLRYYSPAFYEGLEFSFGLQAGVNADIVVEVGFCPPENFGGWYIGVGVAGAYGIGFVVQVVWALPEPAFPGYPNVPQGFTVGGGIGEEVEVAMVVGGGKVNFWAL
jgi:hypothetical protein